MKIGSLFSGIGGLDLGLERSGLGRVVFHAEAEPFCRRVLAKHWPDVPCFDDVAKVPRIPCDVLAGGFPCQDISTANVHGRAGLEGAKSGKWSLFRDQVDLQQPKIVIVENSANWRPWTPRVRKDLHERGYRTQAFRLAAENVGAPHKRARVFVIAYTYARGESALPFNAQTQIVRQTPSVVRHWRQGPPGGYRMDDGVPEGLDRSRALGNAVVPFVGEVIGHMVQAI